MVKIMRKSEEEELKKQQRIRDLKETEGWLTKLRNFNAKVADGTNRQSMLVIGPSSLTVSQKMVLPFAGCISLAG